jgi:hypothetical protein
MENAEIIARFARAREFEVKANAGAWTFTLRMPSDFLERRLGMETAGIKEGGRSEQWLRDNLVAAIVDWQGPTQDDILDDGDKSALAFSPVLTPLLLDHHLAVLDEIGVAFLVERKARREKAEAAAKNSASVSTGS